MTRGFSLIELMVVILIIGIIAAISVPRFLRSPRSDTENFIGRLNRLTSEAVEKANQKAAVYRVMFNIQGKRVEIQTNTGHAEGSSIQIPDAIKINDVIINGKSQFMGTEKRTVYFLINPDGISQEVRLILIDEKVRARYPAGGEYIFYLNPFTSVFRLT